MSTETALVRVRGPNFAAQAGGRAAAKGWTRPGGDWGDPDVTFDEPLVSESTLTPGGAAVVPAWDTVVHGTDPPELIPGSFLGMIENGDNERQFARQQLCFPTGGVPFSNSNPPRLIADGTYAIRRVQFESTDASIPALANPADFILIEIFTATVLAEVDTDELVTLADWDNPAYPWLDPAWVR